MNRKKNIKFLIIAWCLITMQSAFAQQTNYTISKVHSHNDYRQKQPFWLAYNHGLGSIEADTYWKNGKILIGHDEKDLVDSISLAGLYLIPLQNEIAKHPPYPFSDTGKLLQLLVEMKTAGDSEIYPLLKELEKFPTILHNPHTPIVITGHLPSESVVKELPIFVMFDGQFRYVYSPEILSHIAMLSDDLHHFVKWDGTFPISPKEYHILDSIVKRVHQLGKKVRFWNAPDNLLTWKTFQQLGVDYINTDHIETISTYFKSQKDEQEHQ